MDKAHNVSVSMGGRDAAWIDNWRSEAVFNLRKAADVIEQQHIQPGEDMMLVDINGNIIGRLSISK